MNQNNYYVPNQFSGAMNYQRAAIKATYPLTPEDDQILNQGGVQGFSIKFSPTEYAEAICPHRDANGNNTTIENPDGSFTCTKCHQTFRMSDNSELVAQAVEEVDNAIQTIKCLWKDMPLSTAREFFKIRPLMLKIPGMFNEALNRFQQWDEQGLPTFSSGMNPFAQYSALANGAYGQVYNPAYGQGYNAPQGQYAQPQYGAAPQGQYAQSQYGAAPQGQVQPQIVGYDNYGQPVYGAQGQYAQSQYGAQPQVQPQIIGYDNYGQPVYGAAPQPYAQQGQQVQGQANMGQNPFVETPGKAAMYGGNVTPTAEATQVVDKAVSDVKLPAGSKEVENNVKVTKTLGL